MLHQLLESNRRPRRHPLVVTVSVVAHVAVIALALSRPGDASPRVPDDEAIVHPIYTALEQATPISGSRHGVAGGTPTRPRTFAAPGVDVPVVDVGTATVDIGTEPPREAFGGGTVGDVLRGGGMGSGGGEALSFDQVEKPVLPLPGSPAPAYPAMLRAAAVEGRVVARFVVDTMGRVEPGSFRVLESTHELFVGSVRAALPAMRYLPAEAGGRRVRQLVQQTFEFTLER